MVTSTHLQELLTSEEAHLKKLHELVESSLKEEELLSTKLIEAESNQQNYTAAQQLADRVASFGGSWTFIILFLLTILLWILINTFAFLNHQFDPYPFILLNLVLSCIAALQAPIIMMSQNRQEEKDRSRARSDFMINLKSELEVRSLHSKMDLLIADQMRSLFEIQKAQIELLNRIEQKLK